MLLPRPFVSFPEHLRMVDPALLPSLLADGGWSGVLTPALTAEPVLLTNVQAGLLGTLNTLAGIVGGILTAVSTTVLRLFCECFATDLALIWL